MQWSQLYTTDGKRKSEATEEWVKIWKRGEERRALVTDGEISRGWEAPVVMVVAVYGAENHAMRTCGFCFLIKMEKNIISYFLIRHEQSSNSSEVVIMVT